MRPIAATFIYIAFVFLGAALLAPWLYKVVQLAAMEYPGLRPLAQSPFHRYLNRCLIALALIGLWQFLRALQIRSANQLGFTASNPVSDMMRGLLWALAVIALLTGAAVLAQAHVLSSRELLWAKHLRNAVLAALLVPVIEEVLFRAGLFGALRKRWSLWPAAIISSLIYALVHFFARPENPPAVQWDSGFVILGHMLHGFTDWRLFLPAFINLFLIGVLLALAYEKTRAIYFSLGLHAGFIFGAKTFSFLTDPAPRANQWLWGSEKLIDGWAACLALVLLLLLFFRSQRPTSTE